MSVLVCLSICVRVGDVAESRLCLWCEACQSSLHLQREVWKYQLCNQAHCLAIDTHILQHGATGASFTYTKTAVLKMWIIVLPVAVTNVNYNWRKKCLLYLFFVASILNKTKYCGYEIFNCYLLCFSSAVIPDDCAGLACALLSLSIECKGFTHSVFLLHSSCASTAGYF